MSNAENSCSVSSSSPSPFAVPSHPCASFTTRSSRDDKMCTSDTGNPFASIPATFCLANSADIWAITYPSATYPFRPLDGTSVPASAVSTISSLPGFLHVGITVSERGHRLFPTIEKLKDNRMTMRGEPTLPRNHEPMIPRNYKTT